jgi:predicted AlkP superfamily phosphohydrolase/phosphomutase
MQKEELSRRFRDDAAAARIALEVTAETRPQVMMVFLAGIDRVSHRLWASIEPATRYAKPPAMNPRQRAAAREALERYYEYSDALIGLLARGYGASDLVMVVSDHGFEAGEHLGDLTGVHEGELAIDGVVFARGRGIAPGSRSEGTSVNDVTPTILAWLGLPLGRDMEGQVAAFLHLADGESVERIATHDTGKIERIGSAPSGSEGEILDQLRALGYIE